MVELVERLSSHSAAIPTAVACLRNRLVVPMSGSFSLVKEDVDGDVRAGHVTQHRELGFFMQ